MTPGITKNSGSIEPVNESCNTHHGLNHEEEDKWTVLESHDVERGQELDADKAVELSFDSFSVIHLEHDALGGVKTKTTEGKDTHHPSPSFSLHEDVTDMKEMEAIDESEPELPKAPLAREESGSSVASDCSHVATTTNPPLPVAVAITETVHAYFKAKFILQVTGEMIFSFPIEAPTRLATCSAPLTFFLHHTQHIKHPLLHSRILHRVPELDDKANMAFQFDIPALIEQLQELSRKEQAKNHFNITALKYKVDNHEPREAPIILSPHWTYEQAGIIQLTVKYRYNPNAFETPSDLHDVQFVTHIEGDVTSVQATPPAVWHAKQRQITWKLPELQNNNHVTGMLIAKCELKGKPGPPRVMAVRFSSDGASCSGVEVNTGSHSNFKLALVKKSVHSGRYLADACNEEIDNKDK
uniref:SH3-containing GRB2-like protein 3-interacting protein 1 n=1 Tax=Myxine glutinosa TaxID=7769 RepID=UPI00358E6A8F